MDQTREKMFSIKGLLLAILGVIALIGIDQVIAYYTDTDLLRKFTYVSGIVAGGVFGEIYKRFKTENEPIWLVILFSILNIVLVYILFYFSVLVIVQIEGYNMLEVMKHYTFFDFMHSLLSTTVTYSKNFGATSSEAPNVLFEIIFSIATVVTAFNCMKNDGKKISKTEDAIIDE